MIKLKAVIENYVESRRVISNPNNDQCQGDDALQEANLKGTIDGVLGPQVSEFSRSQANSGIRGIVG